jgi:hypothetical protein
MNTLRSLLFLLALITVRVPFTRAHFCHGTQKIYLGLEDAAERETTLHHRERNNTECEKGKIMDDNHYSMISTPMSLSSAFVDEAVKALEERGGDVDIAFCTEKLTAVTTRHNRDARRLSLGQYQLSVKTLPSDSDYLPSYFDNEEKRVADDKIAADIELQYSTTKKQEALQVYMKKVRTN